MNYGGVEWSPRAVKGDLDATNQQDVLVSRNVEHTHGTLIWWSILIFFMLERYFLERDDDDDDDNNVEDVEDSYSEDDDNDCDLYHNYP